MLRLPPTFPVTEEPPDARTASVLAWTVMSFVTASVMLEPGKAAVEAIPLPFRSPDPGTVPAVVWFSTVREFTVTVIPSAFPGSTGA